MELYSQSISLDVNANSSYTIVNAKQGDQNTRELVINFTQNGEPRSLTEGSQLQFRLRKPDGTAVVLEEATGSNPSTLITRDGDKIRIILSGQCLAAAGRGYADVLEMSGTDEERQVLSASSFILNIASQPNVINIKSDSEYKSLFDAVDCAVASASIALEAAASAEWWAEHASPSGLELKADIDSPTFTGTPCAPTPPSGDNSTRIATTAFVIAEAASPSILNTKADIDSPTFTGTPSAPTPAYGENTTRIATAAFVQSALSSHYVIAGQKAGTTLGNRATAEGIDTTASGSYSHAEGFDTIAKYCAHAEGFETQANGNHSHSEGQYSIASGDCAHAEGILTKANGKYSHAEGYSTQANGNCSHAEGQYTFASGYYSHAEGQSTVANHQSQHVFGEYNIADPSPASASRRGTYIEIVGNGDVSIHSNARTLDWNGNEILAGKLTVGASPTANMDVATKQYVDSLYNATASSLSEILQRLIAVESSISSLGSRMNEVESQINYLYGDLDYVYADISSLNRKVSATQSSIGSINSRLTSIESSIYSLDARVTALESGSSDVQVEYDENTMGVVINGSSIYVDDNGFVSLNGTVDNNGILQISGGTSGNVSYNENTDLIEMNGVSFGYDTDNSCIVINSASIDNDGFIEF